MAPIQRTNQNRNAEPVATPNPPKNNRSERQTVSPEKPPVNIFNAPPPPDFLAGLLKFQLMQRAAQNAAPENRIENLREGDRISVPIGARDTQTDVLRAAYSEYAKRAGLAGDAQKRFAEQMVKDGDVILHANSNSAFTAEEFEAKRAQGAINMIPLASDLTAARAAKIQELSSYSIFDWSVSSRDEKQIVDILKSDPNLSETVKELAKNDWLETLLDRVDGNDFRGDLVETLGRKLDADASKIVEPLIEKLDVKESDMDDGGGGSVPVTVVGENLWQIRYNVARLGINPTGAPFDRSRFSDLVSSNPSAPFSGVGATGQNPSGISVPLGDQWKLLREDEATTAEYTNPIPGDLNVYINSLTAHDRARQAQLLLNQPISTTMPEIYGSKLPTRADVIRAAATEYNLEPELVTAFILAEQRDQSQREDGKDYTAATNIVKHANTSIGLGQVVISTAQRNNLFSDLVTQKTQKAMSHDDYARLLADDTANIFAAAKYLRIVADDGARIAPAKLPNTKAKFPAIDLKNYSNNSSKWSADNIRALGSEHTSRAWDDKLSPGWGDFVYEAYKDVRRSNVFNR